MPKQSAGVRQRAVRSDKKRRVNPFIDFQTHQFLLQLAFACELDKTTCAADILTGVVASESFQRYYRANQLKFQYEVNDTCTRVNMPLTQQAHDNLLAFGLALGLKSSKTALAGKILYAALRSSEVVHWMQDRHKVEKHRISLHIHFREGISYLQDGFGTLGGA